MIVHKLLALRRHANLNPNGVEAAAVATTYERGLRPTLFASDVDSRYCFLSGIAGVTG